MTVIRGLHRSVAVAYRRSLGVLGVVFDGIDRIESYVLHYMYRVVIRTQCNIL